MNTKEKSFLSVVIYVHNAEDRIENFLSNIIVFLEQYFESSEIICVNDCSDDRSVEIIRHLSYEMTQISLTLVNMSYYHGLELSMNAGTDLSIGDFVVEFDNIYMDYDLSVIMEVYNRALEGFDIVSASANNKERLSSKLFYNLFDKYSSTGERMQTESFRILSRRIINRVNTANKTIPYRKALYSTSGLKTDNIRYNITEKYRKRIDPTERKYRASLAIDSIILFTNFGYSFSKAMSLLMIFVSVLVLLYTVIAYIFSNPTEGWTSTILFLSVVFFGLFVILTMIIKYLQILVGLVFKRKNYNFESIEKLSK